MILIGQFDSPFVRRVGVALRLYNFNFEHRPWSTFGDADKIATFNPLLRVPTLVLDNGEALIDSAAILDHLDQTVGPSRVLIPVQGAPRRHALHICALATGMADKAVALVYSRLMHREASPDWLARCAGQAAGVADALEEKFSARQGPFWGGDAVGHADIAVACALRFMSDAHPQLMSDKPRPALSALTARCEALAVFQEISQPFLPPAS